MSQRPAVSVVLPCLNEEEALPFVIPKILETLQSNSIIGEVIVCDNNSTDKSAEIARQLGALVVIESRRGYGSAYLTGFAHARGQYLIMGDADDTYDFGLIPKLVDRLKEGFDFVSGSRYLSGGSNKIPILHRIVGNPALTAILNLLFKCRYTDVYCGLRAFTREAYEKIMPVTIGMEFNLELAINAGLAGLRIDEIPITLGTRKGQSKLRTLRDGWRSLRMMLLYCPNKVFILPGLLLFLLGSAALMVSNLGLVTYQKRSLGVGTAIVGTIGCVVGFKILSLGLHAKTYSWSRRFEKDNSFLGRFYHAFTLERGMLLGLTGIAVGCALLGWIVWEWIQSNFQPLRKPETVPLAMALLIIGTETTFASLFISAMSMERKDKPPSTQ